MKKWIVRIVITLLALFLLIGLIPFSKEIHYSGTGYEFSLASDGAVAEHEIRIDGTYSSVLFLKDRFWGTFYVSDVEGLTEDMTVNFSFEPGKRYHPAFQGEAGQPHSTEVAVLFFERNFEELAIQFAYKYEKTEDGLTTGYGDGISNFLVLNATNKEEAMKVYSRMMEEKR
jgi:hypothetical protein